MKNLVLVFGLVQLLIWTDLAQGVAGEDIPLQAGAASVNISPEQLPALMNGGFLQRYASRIVDPLHARALVLSDGKETLAIVIVDSCMVPTTVCDQIKQLASDQTGIKPNRILISATHTHTAPSVMEMCLGTAADEAYVSYMPARVAKAIADAHANLTPAKIGWAIVDAADLTNCRRWITRSDRMGVDPFGQQSVRAMMHPGYKNPNYTSPAGPIDPWLSVLSVVSAEEAAPICVLGNLSMHYFGSREVSADYFGDVSRLLQRHVEKVHGQASSRFVGMMSQGTSGDLHWMDYSTRQRETSRQQYSALVAERILQACSTIEHRGDLELAMAERRLTIERRPPSPERRRWARPINAARGGVPPRTKVEVYAQQAEWIHENRQAEVVLQAIRIGEVGISAIPNEVYGITGLKLKLQSPLAATLNFELANGAAGYIPPPEQHRLGGYTTWPARTAGLSEEAEPQIVEALLRLLEEVAGKKRRPFVAAATEYSRAVARKKPVAYWRLDDMVSDRAEDAVGEQHASYAGSVALFLPESIHAKKPNATFDSPDAYGNRCVYLAGGHIAAEVAAMRAPYSATFCFWNALPVDARDTPGTLLANETESLQISGKEAGSEFGKLVLHIGEEAWTGENRVVEGHWHHVTLVRDEGRVRIYLNGDLEPEIDAVVPSALSRQRWQFGSDGNRESNFDGKFDEIALFDRVLTSAEIAELYRQSGLTVPRQSRYAKQFGAKPTDRQSRQRYGQAVRESGPIAYWRLHEGTQQTTSDSPGKQVAHYEPGSSPLRPDVSAANFRGGRVKSQVSGLGDTYSLELWCRNDLPVDSRPVTAYLFSRAVDGVAGADGDNLGIGGTHSDSGRLFLFNGNGRDQLVAGTTRLIPGSWAHVVMVRQEERMTLYLNGNPQPEIVGNLPIGYPAPCGDILLGGRADGFANLQGMLEEVALYDRALEPDEVVAHFRAAGVEEVNSATQSRQDAPSEPTPTEPDKSVQTIHVPDGFQVELVAAEPLVQDPVAIDWGPDGRLWVVEMADYPLGIDGQGKPGGRVRCLEDSDGDGRFDKSTIFATGLSFPTGILAWDDGVLVTAAPQIVFLADRTGDGQADFRRVLYSGFMEGNQQLRVNGLRRGLDNWIYCASGSHHGGYGKESQILSHLTKTKHPIGSRDFRIRPGSGAIDPQSGPSQYGRNRDDWGNWFGVQNSHPLWHYVLSDHHIRRNRHYAPPNPKWQVVTPANPRVFPASKLQKRYHSFNQSGRFTSACSAMIYRDDYLFDRGTEQHAFTCEPFHNLVQHNVIADEGVSFKFRRDPAESELDFFASHDRWCRPVMVRTGPDGALWVVDMYRYMIEHPEWLPQVGQDELRPWYRSGDDRGRIYRVVRNNVPVRKIPRLADSSAKQLVASLASPSGWERDLAQRLLIEGVGDTEQSGRVSGVGRSRDTEGNYHNRSTIDQLTDLAGSSGQPLARLHALWTLDGMGQLSATLLESALRDSHAGVRRNAVRIAAKNRVDIRRLLPLVTDPNAKVRLELATTLGDYDSPQASVALAELTMCGREDRYLLAAVMSSLNRRNVSDVLSRAIEIAKMEASSIPNDLVDQALAMGRPGAIDQIVESVASGEDEPAGKRQYDLVASVLDLLANRQWSVSALSPATGATIGRTREQARDVVIDEKANVDLRVAAVRLLGQSSDQQEEDFRLLERLLSPRSPSELQRAVVSNLARRSEVVVAEILLRGWRSHSPAIRGEILDALASRKPWASVLCSYLETGAIRVGELSPSVRQRLLNIGDNSPRWHQALALQGSTNRGEVIERFRPALALSGDSVRGSVIFRKTCINCHQLQDEGHDVGPQLTSITNNTREALFTAILDPNAVVDAKYFNYTVITTDGRSFGGRLETETGSSITLLAAEGRRTTILRQDIDELMVSGNS